MNVPRPARPGSSVPSTAALRSGECFNLIGKGYSQLDGYGFINAEAAVDAVRKKK